MRKSLLLLPAVLFVISCSKEAAPPAPTPTPAPAEVAAPAVEPAAVAEPAPSPIAAIDAQVAAIEAQLAAGSLAQTEAVLDPQAFADISENPWAKMHSYSDAGQLVRAKLYSVEPDTGTEVLYFNGGVLFHVVSTPNGASDGDRYYFENGALMALIRADGASVASIDAGFVAANARLQNTANRVLKMGAGR